MGAHTSVDGPNTPGSYQAQLPAELESVVAARRLVASAVSAWRLGDNARGDAALVVSELVTNAVLHTGTTIGVTVRQLGDGVRIEVSDGSPHLPVVEAASPEELLANRSMTGRGLALVAATSDRWGADPTSTGKMIWAEVGTGQRVVASTPPPTFPPTPAEAPVPAAAVAAGVVTRTAVTGGGRRIRLVGVPVELLLESVNQLSDLQREMQVMAMGNNAPPELEGVVQAGRPWSTDIDLWTESDRRVAETAHASGQETVDFELIVPDDIIGRLDGVARWVARATSSLVRRHLLTLPARPEVTAYRQWCAQEITAQIEGRDPLPCPIQGGRLPV